ncbi:uncharacterized protein DUF4150 [Nitrosospira sp. Nsp5]|uniref:Tox-PAAR-like domain-containing protein n=1 Tax=Nitrosospira multiformis TaxID=1231 RepID=A0ABY0TDT7_9PROT|nr:MULTISPECIES: DUF4150 domain-containing protein [Nitrosospira]PTR08971.1 uncharacterized protein DUF4150 [Nitrosospira sp. Nsp5]SDQ68101.1 protein of unknown function [Nitrosospira multiformis]
MSNQVFANGREIACKAGAGKTICAMPDVCFTPPENPATPPGVPVPYPNTGLASDTTEGSKSVMISGKEVMLKHISYFKTLTGDEAGCATKKGVITSKNKGKVYFEAWSMDVKFEGENIDRHLDLTTTNHASDPGDAPPWPYQDSMAPSGVGPEHDIMCAIKKCDKADENGKPYDVSKTAKGGSMPPNSRCSALGSKKHTCVKKTLEKKKQNNVACEQTFDMTKNPPAACSQSPGRGLGRRPDIIVGDPSASPRNIDVYDAKFPCSSGSTSRPVSGQQYMTAKRARNGGRPLKEEKDYKTIAGQGRSKVLTPEDCKNEKCEGD